MKTKIQIGSLISYLAGKEEEVRTGVVASISKDKKYLWVGADYISINKVVDIK